jgi:hypothetical protein
MADRKTLVFTLNDGTAVDSDFLMPYSVTEQIAFEEHFKCSFATVEAATNANIKAAMDAVSAAGGGDAEFDPGKGFRVTWILWFGWFRARPKVASRFSAFLEQLKDWEYIEPVDEPEAIPPESLPDVDPTADVHDLANPVAEDGSPGPTEPVPQPSS